MTRVLATRPGVGETIGVDPSPVFVAKARELARGLTAIALGEADGRSLPFAGSTFDAVVFHTTLCHVPDPEVALREAVRMLRPGSTRLLQLPGLVVAHQFVKSARGVRRGAYTALWIYESREAWEHLWGPPSSRGPLRSTRIPGRSGRKNCSLPCWRTARTRSDSQFMKG